ncbi:MAG: DegT/DnrJ/EryC1/StrS family aminotransferase [Coriobacteriales bacterium]|nr:DegT/DnrJ/EryC1/StrS family aminotransferase [Coriobacteriales bacterium]
MSNDDRTVPELGILAHVMASRTQTRAQDWFCVYKARYGMQVVFDALREERGEGFVVTQLLTCCTAVDPILAAGLVPRYGEVSATTFALDASKLELGSDTRAVVLQHTHGIIDANADATLARMAHEAGALLIEDSAHCVARLSRGADGQPIADVSVHSFGVEKMLPGCYFGGAVWVNPNMADESLRERIVCALRSLSPLPAQLDRAAKAYRNEVRVFTRVPSRVSAALRSSLERVGAFSPAVTQAEQQGKLPLEPYAPSPWIASQASAALAGLDANEERRRACVAAYREVFGQALAQGTISPSLLPASLELLDGQPLLHFPVTFDNEALSNLASRQIAELGYYAVPWYRPFLYPQADPQAYAWDGDTSAMPVCACLSRGALALPTDIEVAGARAVAHKVVSLATLPAEAATDEDATHVPANLSLIQTEEDVTERLVPVIVGGDLLAYSYAREFHHAYNVHPIVLSSIDVKITSSSAWCDYRVLSDLTSEEAIVDHLVAIGRDLAAQGKVGMALGLADGQVRTIITHRDQLAPWFVVPYVDLELLDEITQKDRFYAICEELGIAYPKTWELGCDKDAPELDASAFPYPLIAKPANSAAWEQAEFQGKRKIYELESPEELEQAFAQVRASSYDGKLILQDFVPGDDDAIRSLTTFSNERGDLRVVSGGRVALQDHAPHALGNPVCILGEKVDRIVEDAARFLAHVGYRGYANFDIKYDDRDGSYRFFEVNARPGRNTYYVSLGGVNFVRPLVEEFVLGREVERQEAYDEFLYTIVPASVARSYVLDDALREQVLACYRDDRAQNPLMDPKDTLPHTMWAQLFTQNQVRKFRAYAPGRDDAGEELEA